MSAYEKTCPKCGTPVEVYRHPFPTVDVILFREGSVLLVARRNPPFGWALPGGFVDYGESAEEAARRELAEETGLQAKSLSLLGVYSAPGRDPRFHTLTVVYTAKADGEPTAGDDAKAVEWWPTSQLPDDMAFDHRQIVRDAEGRQAAP